MLCECRRIDDHEVVLAYRHIAKIVDRVTAKACVLSLVKTVESDISVDHHHGLLRAVN